ncbi:MAG: glycoside hydrolase family 3 N-terminal domain-containing protein [Chloroflexota bacterium]
MLTLQTTGDNFRFRDLNNNGQLDPYEDSRLPIEARVFDLLTRMTVAEKAGLMFQTFAAFVFDGGASLLEGDISQSMPGQMVIDQQMNHFNFPNITETRMAAEWQNRMQSLAEETRLGIPITFATDPRHAFSNNPAVSARNGKFSQWPEPIGLAATADSALVEAFADIARQEYLAIGIRVAIHPMADLATEPRWGRINGTFGEDAELAGELIKAYIRGFQGDELGRQSVACMTKHFPGGGPQKDGEDPHFPYGKDQVYPGDNFDYHLHPFEAAFEVQTAQIMPYYGVPIGLDYEEVGFGFNKGIITDLLRGQYGFDGVVCTDYGLVNDKQVMGSTMLAAAWGVEALSIPDRVKQIIEAGCDIIGGEACPDIIVELVESGQLSEARLDESVRRILRDKFRLGLFDNPYVDLDEADQVVGNTRFQTAGAEAQRKSMVLLKNGTINDIPALPLSSRPKIYIEGIDAETAKPYGEVVSELEEADWAILRLETPFQTRDTGNFLERMFHAGDLDFKDEAKTRILNILSKRPTIVVMHLDRPAVIPEIAEASAALLGEFGADDTAILDVIFGQFNPSGKLPFELPRTMEAVQQQKPDLPYDSNNPLFSFGHGLNYR